MDFLKRKKNIIALVLIAVVSICNVAWMYQNGTSAKYEIASKYEFLNPAAMLVDKHDSIVNFQSLRESLQKKYETRDDFLISLYFEYLPTGSNVSINKDEEIWPASLIKIPVAMAAMKKVSDGKWKLSNELVILDEDKDSDFGTMYQLPTGTTMTVETLLKKSLVDSDNTAHFVLLRNLDGGEIEDVYVHLGLDDIIDVIKKTPQGAEVDNRMTAKRYSVFFRSLYNATFLDFEHSQFFMNILKEAPKEYVSLGIPDSVKFVHKTGIRTGDNVRADAGIVYIPNRPYLLTVMLQKKNHIPVEDGEVEKIFEEMSKEIYEYVAQAE
ncbi:MAG: Beta-lactamase [Parcubacteria group bacterium GW2011_GWD2_38_11]|nr:MAG: Beta-lactamase [Parcubacteria group bacterium GW2011_GWD2_38_11]